MAEQTLDSMMLEIAGYLDQTANTLDSWARESQLGGWSTHQVAANRTHADECRRQAARIRLAISKAEDHP